MITKPGRGGAGWWGRRGWVGWRVGDAMTVAVRVIPCLDVDAGRVVKGVNFRDLRDAGDPVELAAAYDAEGADELVFLDITASSGDRETMLDVVGRTADQVFIPLTVGGGVRSVGDVDRLLRARRDKVSLNTAAIARPELLAEAAQRFGSQCVVLSVDARRVADGVPESRFEVTTHGGAGGPRSTRCSGRPAARSWASARSCSTPWMRTARAAILELIRAVRAVVHVPVIASGGPVSWRTSAPRSGRAPTPCWPPACSTSASCGSARSRTRCAWPADPVR